jgi:hypothetical protein
MQATFHPRNPVDSGSKLSPCWLYICFVLLHPCLRILLAIYSEATACMRQLMCTAVSQLRSDQLVPLHHHAHFMYPACLFFLYTRKTDMQGMNADGIDARA